MRYDRPIPSTPLDRQRAVGHGLDRVEGPAKVTGTADYTGDRQPIGGQDMPQALVGRIIGAGIAKGRIAAFDLAAARGAPGVVAVLTYEDLGQLPAGEFYKVPPLAGPEIRHYHQAIALVLAETFEQASHAVELVVARYEPATEITVSLDDALGRAVETGRSEIGDVDAALAQAAMRVDAVYQTADVTHAMMEPHASIAQWQGEDLIVQSSVQILSWARRDLALCLGIAPSRVRVLAPYIGGGFGGKATVLADAVLAAAAARHLGRPVRVVQDRALIINNTTHRPATYQRIRLGADRDGRLTAIWHEAWSGNQPGSPAERATLPTPQLYAAAHRRVVQHLARLDLPEGNAMRAPGEMPGLMALEVAMDELAVGLGLDPVELRLRNDTDTDPSNPSKPFSTRALAQCLTQGAARFGWERRQGARAPRRDGMWQLGTGVAAGIRGAPIAQSAARVALTGQGRLGVFSDMTDLGTGSYTVLAQTAAEMMGLAIDRIDVHLADTDHPVSTGSLGQRGAISSASAVYAACDRLRAKIAAHLGLHHEGMVFEGGEIIAAGRRISFADLPAGLCAEAEMTYGDLAEQYAHQTFAAHFAEVAVHALTGEIRVRRLSSTCACGRILNPKTARSQILGAQLQGLGAALFEGLDVDTGAGVFVNHDLAGYEVPTHMDAPVQDVAFIAEEDATVSVLKAKGVGEIGICGVPAAIANAVFDATGLRFRSYPINVAAVSEMW